MTFLQNLEAHLNLIPAIATAIQTFKAIGSSKESTVAKVGQIVETAATLGEAVPVATVQAVSATVLTIAEEIFGTSAVPAPPASS
jgi:hypothetical protein